MLYQKLVIHTALDSFGLASFTSRLLFTQNRDKFGTKTRAPTRDIHLDKQERRCTREEKQTQLTSPYPAWLVRSWALDDSLLEQLQGKQRIIFSLTGCSWFRSLSLTHSSTDFQLTRHFGHVHEANFLNKALPTIFFKKAKNRSSYAIMEATLVWLNCSPSVHLWC